MKEDIIMSKIENSVDISAIIPCKNEVDSLRWTIDSIVNSKNKLKFEIIVVDDGSVDGSTDFLKGELNENNYKDVTLIKENNVGAAEARNIGAKAARGKYFFFFDAHVKVPDGCFDDLVNTLNKFNADLVAPCITNILKPLSAGYGQTWDNKLKIKWLYNKIEGAKIPIGGAAALGITREAFEKIDGFDHLFQVWGKEDEELCLKAWLYGYKIVINPYVKVRHLFRTKHPYRVTKANVLYNTLCMAYSHFGIDRLRKIIHLTKKESNFSIASEEIKKNEELILNQREKYFKERIYSDDFFFKKFNIPF